MVPINSPKPLAAKVGPMNPEVSTEDIERNKISKTIR